MPWKPFRDARTRARWREELLQEQNGRCALCGLLFPEPGTVDPSHEAKLAPTFYRIVRPSAGGTDALENLRVAHAACNQIHGNAENAAPFYIFIARLLGEAPPRYRR